MNQEQEEVIRNLRIENIWDERLLSNTLFGKALRSLTPREFFVLEERVAGNTFRNIAKQLHTTPKHISNRCSEIKRILETGERNDTVMSELAYRHFGFYKKLKRKKDHDSEKD